MAGEIELFISYVFISRKISPTKQVIKLVTDYLLFYPPKQNGNKGFFQLIKCT